MKRKLVAVGAVVVVVGLILTIGILFRRRPPRTPAVERTAWAVGTVRASDGSPLRGARVTLTNADQVLSATTDGDGNFLVRASPGAYKVRVDAAGRTFDLGMRKLTSDAPAYLTLRTDLPSALRRQYQSVQSAYLDSQRTNARLQARVETLERRTYYPPSPAPAMLPPESPWPSPPSVPDVEVEVEPQPSPVATEPEAATAELPPKKTIEETRCEKEAEPCKVEVFFATDRNILPKKKYPKREANFQVAFGGERSRDRQQPMTYGWCDVTIPPNHRKTTGILDGRKGTYDVEHSVFVWDVVPAKDEDEFVTRLRERVNDDRNREMLVFIHGYNVSFFEAARRTAQMHWDLGFQGAPAFFSWPSGGGLLDYWADEASSEWAAGHLREFLDVLAKRSGAKKIHLVAHSMGSRPLAQALADIGRRNPVCDPPTEAQFSQVIMAAPDLDKDMFLQLKDAMQKATERVTLYASKRDRAVLGSWILHRFTRLGVPTGNPPVDAKIEAVDASNASTGFLGHSYYGASILWDVKFVLAKPELAVDQRCTIDRADPAGSYPRFRRQIDPAAIPPWWRRLLRRKPRPDVITDRCVRPSSTSFAAAN